MHQHPQPAHGNARLSTLAGTRKSPLIAAVARPYLRQMCMNCRFVTALASSRSAWAPEEPSPPPPPLPSPAPAPPAPARAEPRREVCGVVLLDDRSDARLRLRRRVRKSVPAVAGARIAVASRNRRTTSDGGLSGSMRWMSSWNSSRLNELHASTHRTHTRARDAVRVEASCEGRAWVSTRTLHYEAWTP